MSKAEYSEKEYPKTLLWVIAALSLLAALAIPVLRNLEVYSSNPTGELLLNVAMALLLAGSAWGVYRSRLWSLYLFLAAMALSAVHTLLYNDIFIEQTSIWEGLAVDAVILTICCALFYRSRKSLT